MRAVLKYADQGKVLAEYRKCRKFVQVIMGPLGSAKTTTSIQKIIELVCEQKPDQHRKRKSRAIVVRNTYSDLTNTTIRDWRQVVEPLKLGVTTMGRPPQTILNFDLPDGSTVYAEVIFLALDRDEDVRKLRGVQATFVWLNEMKELPKSIFDMLTGRVDRYPKMGWSKWAGIMGDTNAWDADHWLQQIKVKKDAGEDSDGVDEFADYEFFIQPGAVLRDGSGWRVNPERENALNASEKYYQRQIAGKRPDWIKVNLANEIGYYVDGRAVQPDYSDMVHGAKTALEPTPHRQCIVGCDYGLTPAASFWQRQANGQWVCFDEIVIEDGDAIMLAGEINAKVGFWNGKIHGLTWTFRGDPSGDKRAESDSTSAPKVMRANGVPVLPASTNDPTLRRAALSRPLTRMVRGGVPGLVISTACPTLRKGLAGAFYYRRVALTAAEDRFQDVPYKNKYSHVCESAEYALLDAGEHATINAHQPGAMPHGQPAIRTTGAWDPLAV